MHPRLLVVMLLAAACGSSESPATVQDPPPDGGTDMPDALPAIERGHAGGSPNAVVVFGSAAYVAAGPRLAIWDVVSSPPALITESAPLPGVIQAIAITGTRAYVAETVDVTSRIHIFDITTTNPPTETGTFQVGASGQISVVRALAATGTRLYVADQEAGITELDLANPDHPVALQTTGPVGITRLGISGSRLYYSAASFFGGASIGVLDLDDGLAMVGEGSVASAEGIAFTGDLAISAGPDGIYVHDVSEPSMPGELFHLASDDGGPFARAVTTLGTRAYVPADDGLHVLELADPKAVAHTGPLPLPTANVNAAAAWGDRVAIVTDRGTLISVDPANPAAATTADVSLCADCVAVETRGDTVFVTDIVGGLRTASLADLSQLGRAPSLPVIPGSGGLQGAFEDVVVAGTRAYVADWFHGLRIYDVSNARTPALLGSYATGGAPSGLAIDGNRAYIAEGTNGGMLRVIDISDPAHAYELGAFPTSKAMKVVVRDEIAYVADEELFATGGLRILDVSNPATIKQLALYDTGCTTATDVALEGNIVVVACAYDGFHWLDISQPAAPTRVAVMQLAPQNGPAHAVATYAGHYVLGHERGVLVVDDTAQTVASFETAWPVRSLSVPADGRIVAACGMGGVYQWQL